MKRHFAAVITSLAVMSSLSVSPVAWSAGPGDPVVPDVSAFVVPTYKEVKRSFSSSAIDVFDRNGQMLNRVRRDFEVRKGDWLPLAALSPALMRAVIQFEDQRFFQHDGVDWGAFAAAAWHSLTGSGTRGASTISMQVAGFLAPHIARPGRRDIMDKWTQVRLAWQLEQAWTKQQILEAYLNLAPFRGELAGIDALARVMFQKDASGLDMREATLAAALLRTPNASVPVLSRRTCALLTRLGQAGDCDGIETFVGIRLGNSGSFWAGPDGLAPHFARRALTSTGVCNEAHVPHGSESVHTTLDRSLQEFAQDSIRRHLHTLMQANVQDAAVIVLDNISGDVLAYIGSSGALSRAPHVDHVQALRQAGSTLKPFLYAQALQEERLTAASLLNNGPLDVLTSGGLYVPENYDKQFSGWVSVRTALAASLNVPAVRVVEMVGVPAFARLLSRLGLPLDRGGDFYGYSLALGSADVTLSSLANAYRTLANGGRYSRLRCLRGDDEHFRNDVGDSRDAADDLLELHGDTQPPRRVFDPDAAWIVGDILADRQARARTFGLDSPLSTFFWSAVKTGTSKDMRDNWTVGWTRRHTVAVWVGNSGGVSMREVSGVSGAGPIWQDIVRYLDRRWPGSAPPMPDSVHRRAVSFEAGLEPRRLEAFIRDTAVDTVHLAASPETADTVLPRIVGPTSGTIVALDPDIPARHQRVALEATRLGHRAHEFQWVVDGHSLGKGARIWWQPEPGTHRITLMGPGNTAADHTTIHVRVTLSLTAKD